MNGEYYLNDRLTAYKNSEHLKLLDPARLSGAVLKTDCYEEAFGQDYFLRAVLSCSGNLTLADVNDEILHMAEKCLKNLQLENGSAGGRAEFVKTDIKHTPFADNSFDVIFSPSTLDHFPEIDDALSELYRILKPGGKLAISLHNKSNIFLVFNSLLSRIFRTVPYKNYHYTRRVIGEKLARAGFKVICSKPIVHIPVLFPRVSDLLLSGNAAAEAINSWVIRKIYSYTGRENKFHAFTAWYNAFVAQK